MRNPLLSCCSKDGGYQGRSFGDCYLQLHPGSHKKLRKWCHTVLLDFFGATPKFILLVDLYENHGHHFKPFPDNYKQKIQSESDTTKVQQVKKVAGELENAVNQLRNFHLEGNNFQLDQ